MTCFANNITGPMGIFNFTYNLNPSGNATSVPQSFAYIINADDTSSILASTDITSQLALSGSNLMVTATFSSMVPIEPMHTYYPAFCINTSAGNYSTAQQYQVGLTFTASTATNFCDGDSCPRSTWADHDTGTEFQTQITYFCATPLPSAMVTPSAMPAPLPVVSPITHNVVVNFNINTPAVNISALLTTTSMIGLGIAFDHAGSGFLFETLNVTNSTKWASGNMITTFIYRTSLVNVASNNVEA